MVKHICDFCELEVNETIKLTVCDGEHPHNGSTMIVTKDICWECLKFIPDIKSYKEFDDCCKIIKTKRFRSLV